MWTRQLGFLLLTFIYVPVYVRGWRKARTLARLPSSTARGSPAAEAAGTLGNEVVVTLAEPAGSGLPGAYPARPAIPFGSARWIYLLLGLSPRSTHTSHWDAGQS